MPYSTKFRLSVLGLLVGMMGCTQEPRLTPPTPQPIAPSTQAGMTGSMMTGPRGAIAKYISPVDFWDFRTIIGDPPAGSSPEHAEEIAELLALQFSRTPEQARQCQAEEDVTVFVFAEVLGPWFTERSLPKTTQLMQDVLSDARLITNSAKSVWKRDRPPTADPRIKPCVKFDPSFSYPSGNAARGIIWATLLSRVFPDRAEELLAKGLSLGNNRAVAGIHWPTDVYAGQKLGVAVIKKLELNGPFMADWKQAQAELKSAAGR